MLIVTAREIPVIMKLRVTSSVLFHDYSIENDSFVVWKFYKVFTEYVFQSIVAKYQVE